MTFELLGDKEDEELSIDEKLVGKKIFVNTGDLFLNGVVPDKVWTKLYKSVKPGD